MEAFTTLTAVAAPMPKPNINTDDIYPGPASSPIARLHREVFTDRTAMGPNAFAAFRWNSDGTPRPDFILNQPPYDKAKILITGANFGCGSSREHAVWCLAGIGVRCIIAPSFGDIFFNNCFKNGILPVRLPAPVVADLQDQARGAVDPTFTVDLREQVVRAPDGATHGFTVVEYYRQALLGGLDEISATLNRLEKIEAFERRFAAQRDWLSL